MNTQPMSAFTEFMIQGGDYEHTLGITGTYGSGINIRYQAMRPQDIFVPMLETRRYQICEFSLANYLTLRATGKHWFTAVPVFPSRVFRHGLAVTRRDSALTRLEQLEGKRVGVEDYSMTAAVWFRGLLQEEYGVTNRSITWVTRPKQRFAFPEDARVETTTADLEQLLLDGAIDAMLGFTLKDSLLPAQQRQLRPLLADAEREERAYYERTSIYPIMHCVVIRNDVLDRAPALVDAVCRAYATAKERAYSRQLGATLVPWGKNYWARTFEMFRGDPLSYGWTAVNRTVVERLAQYLHQQGFIPDVPDVAKLFALPLIPI
ncbi:MAG: 4,5-dihydroxyphthalate decarboxylase [Betaproteobacteria bacterium]|jgi:4,5-dihydroxyphthalate decarboxylase